MFTSEAPSAPSIPVKDGEQTTLVVGSDTSTASPHQISEPISSESSIPNSSSPIWYAENNGNSAIFTRDFAEAQHHAQSPDVHLWYAQPKPAVFALYDHPAAGLSALYLCSCGVKNPTGQSNVWSKRQFLSKKMTCHGATLVSALPLGYSKDSLDSKASSPLSNYKLSAFAPIVGDPQNANLCAQNIFKITPNFEASEARVDIYSGGTHYFWEKVEELGFVEKLMGPLANPPAAGPVIQ